MKKDQHHHRASLNNQSKDTSLVSELQNILHYLQYHTALASMVSEATGIQQKNNCRYRRHIEKADMLCEIKQSFCLITGFKAWYLSTNPERAQTDNRQLKLWKGLCNE